MTHRKIIAVITAITGDRVVIASDELEIHAKKHFSIPTDMLLGLIERILKDPYVVYEERSTQQYHLFYRLDQVRYILVIVKRTADGVFFSSIYPTGKLIRNKHKKLKKVKI
jgi:hypothetical protein